MDRDKRKIFSKQADHDRYWISKNRRKELKYFCMQYKDWLALTEQIESESDSGYLIKQGRGFKDGVAKRASYLADLARARELIERAAHDADKENWYYIFEAVINGYGWQEVSCKYGLKIDKDIFDLSIRRFFWILSVRKGI